MAMGTKDLQPDEQPEKSTKARRAGAGNADQTADQTADTAVQDETGVAGEPERDGANVVPREPDVDRVASVSYDSQGQPAQTPGFEVLQPDTTTDQTDQTAEAGDDVPAETTDGE